MKPWHPIYISDTYETHPLNFLTALFPYLATFGNSLCGICGRRVVHSTKRHHLHWHRIPNPACHQSTVVHHFCSWLLWSRCRGCGRSSTPQSSCPSKWRTSDPQPLRTYRAAARTHTESCGRPLRFQRLTPGRRSECGHVAVVLWGRCFEWS